MAGLGRRTFAAGEVLTASNVMGYLQDQAVMNFAGTAARGTALGTAVSEGMVSYLADLNQIDVYDGSVWQKVYPSVANIGEVLQVKSTTKTDTQSLASQTWTDITGLSVSITPTSSTNKVLVTFSVGAGATTDTQVSFRIVRDTTAIGVGAVAGTRTQVTSGNYGNSLLSINEVSGEFLDSPATTAATVYKVQFRRTDTAGTVYINRSATDADAANYSRSISTITVTEVKA